MKLGGDDHLKFQRQEPDMYINFFDQQWAVVTETLGVKCKLCATMFVVSNNNTQLNHNLGDE